MTAPTATRRRLPDERPAVTLRVQVGEAHGYVIVGLYDDGSPGEVFIHGWGAYGDEFGGLLDAWATAISYGLQCGIPLDLYACKGARTSFGASGFSGRSDLGYASSVVDAICRALAARFGIDLLEPRGVGEVGDDP